jgi:hypothetical protein
MRIGLTVRLTPRRPRPRSSARPGDRSGCEILASLPHASAGGAALKRVGGKKFAALSGPHDRDLPTDLDVIARWNAAAVVTLLEPAEIADLQVRDLGKEVRRRFMEWHHWPIEDVSSRRTSYGTRIRDCDGQRGIGGSSERREAARTRRRSRKLQRFGVDT